MFQFFTIMFKHFGDYCIIGTMSDSLTALNLRSFAAEIDRFLNFCRIEKGLPANSLRRLYSADLSKFSAISGRFARGSGRGRDPAFNRSFICDQS